MHKQDKQVKQQDITQWLKRSNSQQPKQESQEEKQNQQMQSPKTQKQQIDKSPERQISQSSMQFASPLKKSGIYAFLKKSTVSQEQVKKEPLIKQKYDKIDIFEETTYNLKQSNEFIDFLNQKHKEQNYCSKFDVDDTFSKPMQDQLINQNIPYDVAMNLHRKLIVISETLKQYQYITCQELLIKQENQDIEKFAFEQHQMNVNKKVSELQKLYSEKATNEDNGFCQGVVSVYIPERLYVGCKQVDQPQQLTFNNQLVEEPIINYNEFTCGFDDQESESESDENSNEDLNMQQEQDLINDDNEDDINIRIEDFKGITSLFNDKDIDSETGNLRNDGLRRQIQKFHIMQKQQKDLIYPVPIIVPVSTGRTRELIYYKSDISDKKLINQVQNQNINVYEDKLNQIGLNPVFVPRAEKRLKLLGEDCEYFKLIKNLKQEAVFGNSQLLEDEGEIF